MPKRNYFITAFLWGTFFKIKSKVVQVLCNKEELQNICGQLVLALIPYKSLCDFDCIFCIPKCQEQILFKDSFSTPAPGKVFFPCKGVQGKG